MSYILKALKRSQQERDLGSVPRLQNSYDPAPEPRRRRGTGKLALFLGLNLVAVMVGLWIWQQGYLRNVTDPGEQTAQSDQRDVRDSAKDESSGQLAEQEPNDDGSSASIWAESSGSVVKQSGEESVEQVSSGTPDRDPSRELSSAEIAPSKESEESQKEVAISVEIADPLPALGADEKSLAALEKPVAQYAAIPAYPPVVPLALEDLGTAVPAEESLQAQEIGQSGGAETQSEGQAALPTVEVAALPKVTIDDEANGSFGDVPHIKTLPRHFQLAVPDITISLHVYDEQPGRRFVRINRQKYTEGQEVLEGLSLDAITPRGLVMSYDGQQFRMDSL